MRRALFVLLTVVTASVALAKTQRAPLSPLLLNARTVYIENNSGIAGITDRCYDELQKWGRYKVVTDPEQADLIFQIGTRSIHRGYSGNVSEDGDISLYERRTRLTQVSVIDRATTQLLWSDTRRWGNLFNGFHSATRAVVDELRNRVEAQAKQ